jgi:hypothetical protein
MIEALDELVRIIQGHGINTPITGGKLAALMGWQGRKGRNGDARVRGTVSYLRVERLLPIGSEGDGYFWAIKPEELEGTLEHLRARVEKISQVLYAVKRAQENLRREPNLFG